MVMKKLAAYVAAGVLALGVGCGKDEHQTQKSNKGKVSINQGKRSLEQKVKKAGNPCGNSPVYGEHLWDVECEYGLQMGEDCKVIGIDDSGKNKKILGKYEGLEARFHFSPEREFSVKLSPKSRFLGRVPSKFNHFTSKGRANYDNKVRVTNIMLNKFNGYIVWRKDKRYIVRGEDNRWRRDYMTHNAFVPVDKPFPGEDDCKISQYYWKNHAKKMLSGSSELKAGGTDFKGRVENAVFSTTFMSRARELSGVHITLAKYMMMRGKRENFGVDSFCRYRECSARGAVLANGSYLTSFVVSYEGGKLSLVAPGHTDDGVYKVTAGSSSRGDRRRAALIELAGQLPQTISR